MQQLTDEQRIIVEANIGLVKVVMSKYRHIPQANYEDMLIRMYYQLCLCVLKFDPSRGCSLATYATRSLHGTAKEYMRDDVWIVKPPRNLTRRSIFSAVNEGKSASELEEEFHGVNVEMLLSCGQPVRLDEMRNEYQTDASLVCDADIETAVVEAMHGDWIVSNVFDSLSSMERLHLSLKMKSLHANEIAGELQVSIAKEKEMWQLLRTKAQEIYEQLEES